MLDAGADDYVVKPFTAAQLDARIRAVLRRGRGRPDRDPPLVVGGLRVDPRARHGHAWTATPLELTPREFDLLHYLAARRRRGGHQARAARRGVAAAVRRRGQDRRRAPVLAAPQARRDRAGARATCTPCAGSGVRLVGTDGRRREARGSSLLVAAAVSVLVLVAFLVPLALLVRTVAEDRADARGDRRGPGAGAAGRRRPTRRRSELDRRSRSTRPAPTGHGVPARRHRARRARRRAPPPVELGRTRAERSPRTSAAAGRWSSPVPGRRGRHRGDPGVRARRRADPRGRPGLAAARRARRSCCCCSACWSPTGWPGRWSGRSPTCRRSRTGWPAASWTPGPTGRPARAARGRPARSTSWPAGSRSCCAQERETVADLSHRLRTPLTALRLEAESLRDPDDAARHRAPASTAWSARSTGVIQQARRAGAADGADRPAATRPRSSRERVAFWSVLAEDTEPRACTVDLRGRARCRCALPADDLAAARGRAARQRLRAHPGRHRVRRATGRPRDGGGAC